jgi:hypothetical protein
VWLSPEAIATALTLRAVFRLAKAGSAPVRLLVDSTGLRLCGPGEWLVEKHGTERRRAWRVLHLATDADTGRIAVDVLNRMLDLGRPNYVRIA